jgi:aminopeptidase N
MRNKALILMAALAVAAGAAVAQIRRPQAAATKTGEAAIDVQSYRIDAEVDPEAQLLRATAEVHFTPSGGDASTLTVELNNAFEVQRIEDGAGDPVSGQRIEQNHSLRLLFANAYPEGKPGVVKFTYAGRLTGGEESPVWGIKFAAIHPEHAFFMYPARWFPVIGYTADRFAADLRVTVPAGYRVAASGAASVESAADGRQIYRFHFERNSFPGSFAVLRGEPQEFRAGPSRVTFFGHGASNQAQAYANEIGRAMEYFSGLFGALASPDITLVETEAGAPNGYAAPGLLFFSPAAMPNGDVNRRLVANQVSRQWWGMLLSASTRNHLWWQNGLARYSEILYLEETEGRAARNNLVRDTYVEALTVEQPPAIQAARLEDYSPEFNALTEGKGAAVLHMLRSIIGDEKFRQLLKLVPARFAWQSFDSEQFEKLAEEVSGENLYGFFLQWIESSGAPEFRMEYTTFRTSNPSGFRVNGKISQDLDLFRMPVKLRIDTEGNPEEKTVVVSGTSSEFVVETFGKPVDVVLDPDREVLRYDDEMRVAVAIRRGEQFFEIAEYVEAIKEYEKALQVKRNSSLALFRVGEVFFTQNNLQEAANKFREALSGDLQPAWVEVWSRIKLGQIFDITGDRARAVNEYRLAVRTRDNTAGALEEAERYLQTPYERERPRF